MMDIMMPRMSGADALEQIRDSGWGKELPILMLSNMSEPEKVKAICETSQKTECLLKTDWTLEQLTEHIKKLLAA